MLFKSSDNLNDKDILFTGKQLWLLIFPLIIEQTFISLMGMADTLMVSRLGDAAISAVSSVDQINILILGIFESLALGGNVLCSQYTGRNDKESVRNLVMQLIMLVGTLSVIFTVPFALFPKTVIKLIYPSSDSELLHQSAIYCRITGLSYPFLAIYSASAALYRSVGNAKLPVTVVTTGNILNVIGNAVLIFVFRLGVAGAALATTLSRVFCCGVLLFFQLRQGQTISLTSPRHFRFIKSSVLSILSIGIPSALEGGIFHLGKIVVQAIVISLGTANAAAQAIITQLETLASRPALAIGIALLTVAGQYIGSGRPDLARSYTNRFCIYSTLCCLVTGIIVMAATPAVCSMTALSPESSRLIFNILLFISVVKVFIWTPSFIYNYTFKAAGDVKGPVYISCISMWVFRVLLAYVLCTYTSLALWGIWAGWIADWLFRAVMFLPRFYKGRWMELKII